MPIKRLPTHNALLSLYSAMAQSLCGACALHVRVPQEDRWALTLAEASTLSDLAKAVEFLDQRIRARNLLANHVTPAQQRRLLQLQLCCDQCWTVAEKTVRALQSNLDRAQAAARDQRLNADKAVSSLQDEAARMRDEKDRQIERLVQEAAHEAERRNAELQEEKESGSRKLERSQATAKEAAEAAGARSLEAMRRLQAEQQAKEERERSVDQAAMGRMQETLADYTKKLDDQQAAHVSALQGLQDEALKSQWEAARWEKAAQELEEQLAAASKELDEQQAAHASALQELQHREAEERLRLQELLSQLERKLRQSESAARDQRLNAEKVVSMLQDEAARMGDEKDRADHERALQLERSAQEVKLLRAELQASTAMARCAAGEYAIVSCFVAFVS